MAISTAQSLEGKSILLDYMTVQNLERIMLKKLPERLFFTPLFNYSATRKRKIANLDITNIRDQFKKQKIKEPTPVGEAAAFTEVTMEGISMGMSTFLKTGVQFNFTDEFLEDNYYAEENINVIDLNLQEFAKTFANVLNRTIADALFGNPDATKFCTTIPDEDGNDIALSDWRNQPMIDDDYIELYDFYRRVTDDELLKSVADGSLYKCAAKYDLGMMTPASYNNLGSELGMHSTRVYEGVQLMNSLRGFKSASPDLLTPTTAPFNGKKINWIGWGMNPPEVRFYVNPRYSAIAPAYYNRHVSAQDVALDANVPVPMINITPTFTDPYDPEVHFFKMFQAATLNIPYPESIVLGHIPDGEILGLAGEMNDAIDENSE